MLTRKRLREDPEASFYSERTIGWEVYQEWRDNAGQLHRTDGPAEVRMFENVRGRRRESRWIHGLTIGVPLHLPTTEWFNSSGTSDGREYGQTCHEIVVTNLWGNNKFPRYSTSHICMGEPRVWGNADDPMIRSTCIERNMDAIEQQSTYLRAARSHVVEAVQLLDLAHIVMDYLVDLPFPEFPVTTRTELK